VPHPVRLVVRDDLRRTRSTVALRLPLALPHLLLLTVWAATVALLLPVLWLSLVVTGRSLRPLDAVNFRFGRYGIAVAAYALLLADARPRLGASASPVDLEVDAAFPRRRGPVLIRPVLALPGAVFASVLGVAAIGVAVPAWFAGVAAGRMPEALEELGVYCLRFVAQASAYVILLTDTAPSLDGAAGLVTPRREVR
jgi:Domain of unknown function (DUF4389)